MSFSVFIFFGLFTSISYAGFEKELLPVIEEYCLDCHSEDVTKGGVNFDPFLTEQDYLMERNFWMTVYDQLEGKQMPPPKRKKQLNDEMRSKVLLYIEKSFKLPDVQLASVDAGKPTMRRLTRLEYNNTVRDLFGLKRDVFKFNERLNMSSKEYFNKEHFGDFLYTNFQDTNSNKSKSFPLLRKAGLPGDNRASHGFSNRGDVMNFSTSALDQYIALADKLIQSEDFVKESHVFQKLTGGHTSDLISFMKRAFRREPNRQEKKIFTDIYKKSLKAGTTKIEAIKRTLKVILSSPSFLFIHEKEDSSQPRVRRLNQDELASRLSYFLWSSMPDEALTDSQLKNIKVLDQQIDRMLKDKKSKELSESFAYQWMRLDQVLISKPDQRVYKSFYTRVNRSIHQSVILEPILFFETILREDRSLLEFIDSDYTWMNVNIIKHYQLEEYYQKEIDSVTSERKNKKGDLVKQIDQSRWFRVKLPSRLRGGIMTMAAPLLITSMPKRTSPVKRGSWVLETMFNRPPTEPKEAFELEEAKKEGDKPKTLRAKFNEHRSNKACFSCHIRIDPLGFALENFDGIGRFRTKDNEETVDSSGVWNEQAFNTPATFKDALLVNPNEFLRGFVEHLLSYALGRKLEYYDRTVVAEIIERLEKNDYKFSEAIKGIVHSRSFQYVRNYPGFKKVTLK